MRVRARFWGEGSVRAETVRAGCESIEALLELESNEDRAALAKLARLAEAGCFVMQTLRAPAATSYAVTLNGAPLDLGS